MDKPFGTSLALLLCLVSPTAQRVPTTGSPPADIYANISHSRNPTSQQRPSDSPISEIIVDDLDDEDSPNGWFQMHEEHVHIIPDIGESGADDTTFREHAYFVNGTQPPWSDTGHWGLWVPLLPAPGKWEIFAFIPSVATGKPDTTRAQYLVSTPEGLLPAEIDQDHHGRARTGWVSMGTYNLGDEAQIMSIERFGAVILRDTTPDYSNKTVLFDAIKWVKREDKVDTCSFNEPNIDFSLPDGDPRAGEPFRIKAEGVSGDSCTPVSPSVSVAGDTITLHLTESSCGNTCFQVPTVWTQIFNVPALSAGTYWTDLNFTCGAESKVCSTVSVEVAPRIATATATQRPTVTPPPTPSRTPRSTPTTSPPQRPPNLRLAEVTWRLPPQSCQALSLDLRLTETTDQLFDVGDGHYRVEIEITPGYLREPYTLEFDSRDSASLQRLSPRRLTNFAPGRSATITVHDLVFDSNIEGGTIKIRVQPLAGETVLSDNEKTTLLTVTGWATQCVKAGFQAMSILKMSFLHLTGLARSLKTHLILEAGQRVCACVGTTRQIWGPDVRDCIVSETVRLFSRAPKETITSLLAEWSKGIFQMLKGASADIVGCALELRHLMLEVAGALSHARIASISGVMSDGDAVPMLSDTAGRRLGIVSGVPVEEIASGRVVQVDDTVVVWHEGADAARLTMTGTGTRGANLAIVVSRNTSGVIADYGAIPTNGSMFGQIELTSDSLVLLIDDDGDGDTDSSIVPRLELIPRIPAGPGTSQAFLPITMRRMRLREVDFPTATRTLASPGDSPTPHPTSRPPEPTITPIPPGPTDTAEPEPPQACNSTSPEGGEAIARRDSGIDKGVSAPDGWWVHFEFWFRGWNEGVDYTRLVQGPFDYQPFNLLADVTVWFFPPTCSKEQVEGRIARHWELRRQAGENPQWADFPTWVKLLNR